MSDYLRTIFHLAEASDFIDPDEAEQERIDNLAYERRLREREFEQKLRSQLDRMGVILLEDQYALYYDEENRELTLKIDDKLNLQQFQALASLGTDIRIDASCGADHYPYLSVEITTHEGLSIR
jgi:hypothetical protein